jgi:hypothetical protein
MLVVRTSNRLILDEAYRDFIALVAAPTERKPPMLAQSCLRCPDPVGEDGANLASSAGSDVP